MLSLVKEGLEQYLAPPKMLDVGFLDDVYRDSHNRRNLVLGINLKKFYNLLK